MPYPFKSLDNKTTWKKLHNELLGVESTFVVITPLINLCCDMVITFATDVEN
jgi:hypothetical protein